MAEPWWKTREREKDEHRSAVSIGCWRAGLSVDQNPDDVSRAFDRGTSAQQYVQQQLEKRNAKQREEAERAEEQARLGAVCAYDGRGGDCWGTIDHRGYDSMSQYANAIRTCEAHARVFSEMVYVDEDGNETPVEEE